MSVAADIIQASPRGGRLLRLLGVGFGIAVGVGATIGAGILRTPGEVAGYTRTAGLCLAVWLIGGLYTLLCATSITELTTMLPRAGGWYVYAERAFGKRVGFVAGCIRPYRARWYPWSTLCGLAVSVAFLFGVIVGDLRHSLFAIILAFLSYLFARVIVPRAGGRAA